jgi:hypothetical protein
LVATVEVFVGEPPVVVLPPLEAGAAFFALDVLVMFIPLHGVVWQRTNKFATNYIISQNT